MQPMQETTAWVVVTDQGTPLLLTLAETEARAIELFEDWFHPWSWDVPNARNLRRVRITEVAE